MVLWGDITHMFLCLSQKTREPGDKLRFNTHLYPCSQATLSFSIMPHVFQRASLKKWELSWDDANIFMDS